MQTLLIAISIFISPLVFADGVSKAEIKRLLASYSDLPPAERAVVFSERFVGLPYILDGFGEGAAGRYDQDPLYRFDGFDCTTYVETLTAMALSRNFETFERLIDQIRYKNGEISYVARKHFPSLDWVPENIKAGFYEDITYDIADGDVPVHTARATIDKRTWYSKKTFWDLRVPDLSNDEAARRVQEWRGEGLAFSVAEATLPYIALKDIFPNNTAVLRRIPAGAIINIVRPGWDIRDKSGELITQMNVSHQALVVYKNGKPYLRHASSEAKKVADMPLDWYLRRFVDHPTIRGIHVLRIK